MIAITNSGNFVRFPRPDDPRIPLLVDALTVRPLSNYAPADTRAFPAFKRLAPALFQVCRFAKRRQSNLNNRRKKKRKKKMTASEHKRHAETKSRVFKGKDGMYHVNGKEFSKLRGERSEVIKGVAFQTTGGLQKNQLKMQKESGKVVSVSKVESGKRPASSNIIRYNRVGR